MKQLLDALTPDTQATLLLVGQFSKTAEAKPLTLAEYNGLAKQLLDLRLRPADLLRELPNGLLVDTARLAALLSRGTSLALAVERWGQLGIGVIGRGDEAYPKHLKRKLRGAAAPVLYIAGNRDLLNAEGVCAVGSRNASDAGIQFASELGKRCAEEGLTIVSGDARGIDRAAMDGALRKGGSVTGVLVEALTKAVLSKRNREAILAGKLTLVSPYDPEAGFTVPKAMDRNKYLYALASAAVVIDSDIKGGTWSGAVENDKHRWTPAFVRASFDAPIGNQKLAARGLREVSFQDLASNIRALFSSDQNDSRQQLDLLHRNEVEGEAEIGSGPKSMYPYFLTELTAFLDDSGPQSVLAVSERFDLEETQAERWLERALRDEVLERLQRPVRFTLKRGEG